VPIDARSEMPDLSTRAAERADQALRIFDHLAGNTEGEEQFEAAWRCGRSLALLGRYDDALDAFNFAHHTLRGMHPSDTPPHLKPLADGLSEDRKRVAYLRDGVSKQGRSPFWRSPFRRDATAAVASGHATHPASGYRRPLLPRPQPGQRPLPHVPQGRGLRGIRAGAGGGGGSGRRLGEPAGVLRDGQSLAPGDPDPRGRGDGADDEGADHDPRRAVSRGARPGRARPTVSGPIQIVSHRG